MKQFLVPVVRVTETRGHIAIFAESMEKANSIVLSQEQMAYMFKSHHVDNVSFELESKYKYINY